MQTETGLSYEILPETAMEMKRMIAYLHNENRVTRFVNVGPAAAIRPADIKSIGSDELESIDSIELDPMLSWFWPSVRVQAIALA